MHLINFKTLAKKLGNRSRSSVYRDMLKGFPKPIVLGNTNLWSVDAVDQYLQELAEVPYQPQPVAVPKDGNRRGRKKNQKDVGHGK
jgi:predicted DNA-binding transcriptional regulator AlpA